jgi:hypothetical protein
LTKLIAFHNDFDWFNCFHLFPFVSIQIPKQFCVTFNSSFPIIWHTSPPLLR